MKKILALILLLVMLYFQAELTFAVSKDKDELTKIETQIYGFNYDNNTDIQRLERLEQYAYGGAKSGAIDKRIANLKKDLNFVEEPPAPTQKTAHNPKQQSYYDYDYDDYDYYDQSSLVADASAQYPVVDALEKKLFNKTSANEDIYSRVSKLEKQIFKKETPSVPLSDRVDKLKSAIITDVAVAGYDDDGNVTLTPSYRQLNPGYGYNSPPQEVYSQDYLTSGSLYNEVSILERDVLKSTHPSLPIEERLTKLEKKVLQKAYPNDDNMTRLERVAAAAEAQKSSSHYGGSKFEKNLATGMQIAGFILMVLAFVL